MSINLAGIKEAMGQVKELSELVNLAGNLSNGGNQGGWNEQPPQGGGRGRGRGAPRDYSHIQCNHPTCKQWGHFSSVCPVKAKEEQDKDQLLNDLLKEQKMMRESLHSMTGAASGFAGSPMAAQE